MTPPEAPDHQTGTLPPAVLTCPLETDEVAPKSADGLTVLKIRKHFLMAARAGRQGTASMMVQARERRADEGVGGIRVGFTCSKKVGNAVARNRAKRRLREIARLSLPENGLPGWDYVLIGRHATTAARSFPELLADFRHALTRLHDQ